MVLALLTHRLMACQPPAGGVLTWTAASQSRAIHPSFNLLDGLQAGRR